MDHLMHECSTGFIKGIAWGGALFGMLMTYLWSPSTLLSIALLSWGAALAHRRMHAQAPDTITSA